MQNSGHWTMDAATVSQFENHIRAVAGFGRWPSPSALDDRRMTNLIGAEVAVPRVAAVPERACTSMARARPAPAVKWGM